MERTTDSPIGLASADARARLVRQGPNELPRSRTRSLLASAAHALAEPMLGLLVVAALVYFALGDRVEALFLLASVVVIMAIALYQEHKTESVLQALRDLAAPRALVIRDGIEQGIPGRDVVVDDVLVIREGDRIAADAILIESSDVRIDESLLTGESVPVHKHELQLAGSNGSSNGTHVYAGTLVVGGHGMARVTAIGGRVNSAASGARWNRWTRSQPRCRSRYVAWCSRLLLQHPCYARSSSP